MSSIDLNQTVDEKCDIDSDVNNQGVNFNPSMCKWRAQ